MRITWTMDADAAGTRTILDAWAAGTLKHILFAANTSDGQAVAFYLPNAKPVGDRPSQRTVNGLNQITVTYEGLSGPTSTTELTHSAWRMALG